MKKHCKGGNKARMQSETAYGEKNGATHKKILFIGVSRVLTASGRPKLISALSLSFGHPVDRAIKIQNNKYLRNIITRYM